MKRPSSRSSPSASQPSKTSAPAGVRRTPKVSLRQDCAVALASATWIPRSESKQSHLGEGERVRRLHRTEEGAGS